MEPSARAALALPCATPTKLPQDIFGQFGAIYAKNHPQGVISDESVLGNWVIGFPPPRAVLGYGMSSSVTPNIPTSLPATP